MKYIQSICLCVPVLMLVSCTPKKDRLTADTLVIAVDPSTVSLSTGTTKTLTAICKSAASSNVSISPAWTVDSNLGSFNPPNGKITTFTASSTNVGRGQIHATYSGIIGTAMVSISSMSTNGSVSNTYATQKIIYSDAGIATDSVALYTWGTGIFNGNYADSTAPEGSKSFQTVCTGAYAGWGITYTTNTPINLSAFTGGYLDLWIKSSIDIKIEIQDGTGNSYDVNASAYYNLNNTWKEIKIPLTDFAGLSLNSISMAFDTTIAAPGIFYIDYVRYGK